MDHRELKTDNRELRLKIQALLAENVALKAQLNERSHSTTFPSAEKRGHEKTVDTGKGSK